MAPSIGKWFSVLSNRLQHLQLALSICNWISAFANGFEYWKVALSFGKWVSTLANCCRHWQMVLSICQQLGKWLPVFYSVIINYFRCKQWILNVGADNLGTNEPLRLNASGRVSSPMFMILCVCVQPAKKVLFYHLFLIMSLVFLQRLCSAHFEPTQFINDDMERLIWKAIPTLFGDRKPVVRLHSNQSTQVRTLSRCLSSTLSTGKYGCQFLTAI